MAPVPAPPLAALSVVVLSTTLRGPATVNAIVCVPGVTCSWYVAVAELNPELAALVAVMVAVPVPTSVATPVVEFTVATVAEPLAYVTAPVPAPPEATFVTVVPTAPVTGPPVAKAIVWGCGGGCCGGPPPPPPHALTNSASDIIPAYDINVRKIMDCLPARQLTSLYSPPLCPAIP